MPRKWVLVRRTLKESRRKILFQQTRVVGIDKVQY